MSREIVYFVPPGRVQNQYSLQLASKARDYLRLNDEIKHWRDNNVIKVFMISWTGRKWECFPQGLVQLYSQLLSFYSSEQHRHLNHCDL